MKLIWNLREKIKLQRRRVKSFSLQLRTCNLFMISLICWVNTHYKYIWPRGSLSARCQRHFFKVCRQTGWAPLPVVPDFLRACAIVQARHRFFQKITVRFLSFFRHFRHFFFQELQPAGHSHPSFLNFIHSCSCIKHFFHTFFSFLFCFSHSAVAAPCQYAKTRWFIRLTNKPM